MQPNAHRDRGRASPGAHGGAARKRPRGQLTRPRAERPARRRLHDGSRSGAAPRCGTGADATSSLSEGPAAGGRRQLCGRGGLPRGSAAQGEPALAASRPGTASKQPSQVAGVLESSDHAFAHGKQENPPDRADFKSLLSRLVLPRHTRCPCPELQLRDTPDAFGRYFEGRTLQVRKLLNRSEVSSCALTCLAQTAPSTERRDRGL